MTIGLSKAAMAKKRQLSLYDTDADQHGNFYDRNVTRKDGDNIQKERSKL
jgi:hypothetical protein